MIFEVGPDIPQEQQHNIREAQPRIRPGVGGWDAVAMEPPENISVVSRSCIVVCCSLRAAATAVQQLQHLNIASMRSEVCALWIQGARGGPERASIKGCRSGPCSLPWRRSPVPKGMVDPVNEEIAMRPILGDSRQLQPCSLSSRDREDSGNEKKISTSRLLCPVAGAHVAAVQGQAGSWERIHFSISRRPLRAHSTVQEGPQGHGGSSVRR